MSELKLSYETMRVANKHKIEFYLCGGYRITVIDDAIYNVSTRQNCHDRYLPIIHIDKDDNEAETVDFRIQTTSYGALAEEDFMLFIKDNQYALKTVETLKKCFNMSNGRIDKKSSYVEF